MKKATIIFICIYLIFLVAFILFLRYDLKKLQEEWAEQDIYSREYSFGYKGTSTNFIKKVNFSNLTLNFSSELKWKKII